MPPRNAVELISSPLVTAAGNSRHGFFTRRGGVSHSIYASLNCAPASRDDPDCVRENRARVALELGLAPESMCSPRQAHTARVLTIDRPFGTPRPVADALVTRTPGLGLGVVGADCAPVLLSDPAANVVGAAHAGWKGALTGILEATVKAMCALGASRAGIRACIGPAIQRTSYRVGEDLYNVFLEADPSNRQFFIGPAGSERYRFDLTGFLQRRLLSEGLSAVECLPHDTFADPSRFFSYRRSCLAGEADYGRQISVIALE